MQIAFRENESVVPLDKVAGIPSHWKNGLPPGRYSMQFESNPPASFEVESTARREQVAAWLKEWRRLNSDRSSALVAFVAVEYLTAQQPHPYLADALDVLDDLDPKLLTRFLQQRRQDIVSLLQTGAEPADRDLSKDNVGIAEIDEARRSIARGRWSDALRQLQSLPDSADARGRALADLYCGVVHAESGLGQEQAADFYFRRAISGLSNASAADRFRAHNNYANFLLNRSQDRLFNHAFQMAVGARHLFITAVTSWDEARVHYDLALELASQLGPGERTTVQVNLARLYATLADIVATLEPLESGQKKLKVVEQAVDQTADQFARTAAADLSDADPFASSVSETIRAHLAFRDRDATRCREHAQRALDGYIQCGSLAGIESIERLLGSLALRAPQFAGVGETSISSGREALSHFRKSHMLSELLRAQVPADRVGLTRAGFFARRIYVNERIVELLIAEGRDVEALRYVELAKARALQDLLATESNVGSAQPEQCQDLETILQRWPTDVIALEYFLTGERAWLFVIARGKVHVYPLVDDAGQPLVARDLVAQVRAVLRDDLNNYAMKMQKRLLDGSGFDTAWQDRLHGLERRLLPANVLAQLPTAHTLLIVPHHILHYFPFAALVTQPDMAQRGPFEIVQPRFLIDEACDICYAPSLVAWDNLRRRPDRAIADAAAIGIARLPGTQPLPGVDAELQSLRAALGPRLKIVVTDEDAHMANTLALMKQPGLLVIGTHGRNWPDEPLSSELLLYPRASDNGRLTASQLYGSEVGRDLIVLSACYTALADRSPLPGDDLFGVQRALLQSGGRTVVAGQWDIYDGSGPALMHDFFAHLAEGQPAHRALAQSQRQFLARLRASADPEPWLHPYFWAVFTVCGDDRVRFQPLQ
jgi:CHAT domain-containing protein